MCWYFVALIWHYSSLAALTALAAAPIYAALSGNEVATLTYALLTLLSYYRHRGNIKRLIQGTENKVR